MRKNVRREQNGPAGTGPPAQGRNNPEGLGTIWLPNGDRQRLDNSAIQAAIDHGPHKSAFEPDTLKHFAAEVADKVAKGQEHVVLWDDIKHNHPKQLKISPVAAIPHKSRTY
jgi:hypothetical protein